MRWTLPCGLPGRPASVFVAVPYGLARVLVRGVFLLSSLIAIKAGIPIMLAVAVWVQSQGGRAGLRVDWDGHDAGVVGWWLLGLLLVLVALLIGTVVVCSRVPKFAVCVEGIKLPMGMANRGTRMWSSWNPGTWGFYPWEDVERCHWGRYQPSNLMIYCRAIERRVVVLWGDAPRQVFPAGVCEYRVPEEYRERVEAAIRTCGKWRD